MNCPRILAVGHLPPPYTGQTVALDILRRQLPKYGFTVKVCDTGGPGLAQRERREVRRRSAPRAMEVAFAFRKLPTLVRACDMVYVTLAQSKLGFVRDAFSILCGLSAGRPVIGHLHGGNYAEFHDSCGPLLRALNKAVLRQLSRVVVLSERLKEQFAFDRDLMGKLEVVPNGVPCHAERDPVTEKDWDVSAPLSVLFLSNMYPSKGYMDVLEACRILSNWGVHFECAFCGQFADSGQREFEQKIRACGLRDIVEYRGRVLGSEKVNVLTRAHVMVLPTNYKNEGQPLSVIEGMAYGQAVLTTRYRALPDLVEEGKNGYFVEYGRPGQIAERLRELADDRPLLRDMCKASRERYRSTFQEQQHMDKIAKVFRSVLGNRGERS